VGSGNNDVGNATPTRKSDQPAALEAELRIDSLPDPERQERRLKRPASICGAMSQQGGGFRGDISAPQGFVRLVGCHDAKVRRHAHQVSEPAKR